MQSKRILDRGVTLFERERTPGNETNGGAAAGPDSRQSTVYSTVQLQAGAVVFSGANLSEPELHANRTQD